MNQLTQEQLKKINSIEQQVQDLIKSTFLDELKQDYNLFLELLDYAKRGDFFLFRTANQNKKLEDGEVSAKKFFRGNEKYLVTSFFDFKKSDTLNEKFNQATVYPCSFVLLNNGNFYFEINIANNRSLIEIFNKEVLPILTKNITLFKREDNEDRLKYQSESFDDIHSLISQIKPVLDEIFKDKDYIKTWDFKEFVEAFEKRINFIKKTISEKNPQTLKINSDSNTAEATNQQSAKNTILFGPPGTGKTYSLKRKVEEISKEDFKTLKNEGRVEFITFHPSYSYEEFVEGISVDTSADEIKYILRDGIFKALSKKIISDALINSEIGFDDLKSFDDAIEKLKEDVIRKEEIELTTDNNYKFKLYYKNGKTFRVKPLNSSTSIDYAASLENIKALHFKSKELSEIYNVSYVRGILNYMIKNNYLSENKKELKNIYEDLKKSQRKSLFDSSKPYFLLIDEINRGDMAKIFGELITLLEEDKRLGEDEEFIIDKLPNSQESFGVPPNLYIIGTMNTADRSISLIDIALRRRFEFEEMMPKLDDNSLFVHLNHIQEFDNFRKFIVEVNNNISDDEDIGRDKQIGHAFLLKIKQETYKEDIIRVWNKKIMPLLEEYTYGEISKLENILKVENKFEIDGLSMKKENRFILN
ncbi:MAG: McrB family protein [Candidatus Woesearchaeota archaeon]